MSVYFYNFDKHYLNMSSYKKSSFEQIQSCINNSKQFNFVQDINCAEYIILLVDNLEEIRCKYPNRKLIIINASDALLNDNDELFNYDNIIVVLDHHKKNNSLNFKYNNKILPILHYGNIYKRLLKKNNNVLPIQNRKYDVVFLGNIQYNEAITLHRKTVIERMLLFCKKYNFQTYFSPDESRTTDVKTFYEVISNTKIFVSPFGWGEWSLKDYECICLGCHTIVPNLCLSSYPNFYENFDTFELDFSNFDQKLLYLLSNLDIVQKKVNTNRKIFYNFNNLDQSECLENFILNNVN